MEALELFEIEDRGVGRIFPPSGKGFAWVWSGGTWREAPVLVVKASFDGFRLDRDAFAAEFPDADLAALDKLANGVLDSNAA